MACDLRNRIRKCIQCKKFEAAPPVAPLRPLTCSGPGELLHVDFTSIEETVQTARTAAETLRNNYFGLFGTPAYLISNQGKAFTGHLISNLCELYGYRSSELRLTMLKLMVR